MACSSCTSECLCAIVAGDATITVTGSGSGPDPYRIFANLCPLISTLPNNARTEQATDLIPVKAQSGACEVVGPQPWAGVGGGIVNVFVTGNLGHAPVITVTCEDVQDCASPMMIGNGFTYNDPAGKWDTTGTGSQVLTSDGAGGATWQTVVIPDCETVQDCVGPMLASEGFVYNDALARWTNPGGSGQVLTSNGSGDASWGTVVIPNCEAVQDCVGGMLISQGMTYDDANADFTNGGTSGQVLTSNGSGDATWVTPTVPNCEAVQDCVANMLLPLSIQYNDAGNAFQIPPGVPAGSLLTADGGGTAGWYPAPITGPFVGISRFDWPPLPWDADAGSFVPGTIYYNTRSAGVFAGTPWFVLTPGNFAYEGQMFSSELIKEVTRRTSDDTGILPAFGPSGSSSGRAEEGSFGGILYDNKLTLFDGCTTDNFSADVPASAITVTLSGGASGSKADVGSDLVLTFSIPSGGQVKYDWAPHAVAPVSGETVKILNHLTMKTSLDTAQWFDLSVLYGINTNGGFGTSGTAHHPYFQAYESGTGASFSTTPQYGEYLDYLIAWNSSGFPGFTTLAPLLQITNGGASTVSGTITIPINEPIITIWGCDPNLVGGGGSSSSYTSILSSTKDAALITMTRIGE